MKQKSLFLAALLLLMAFLFLPTEAQAAEVVQSGACGEAVTWTLDSDGVLTISGTGPLENFDLFTALFGSGSSVYDVHSLVIEEGITEIGDYTFRGFSGLHNISLPHSITAIGSSAFSGCNGLIELVLPGAVTSIGENAFSSCYNLKTVVLPNGLTTIPEQAFWSCSGLTSVTIPASVTTIESQAFAGCGFTEFTLPATVETWGSSVLADCRNLANVELPANMAHIPAGLLSGCHALTEIQLPAGLITVGSNAFNDCKNLTAVTLPNTVTSLGGGAFAGTAITELVIPAGVNTVGGGLFERCALLTQVTLPTNINRLDSYTFSYCDSLTEVIVPDGVLSIDTYTFFCCPKLSRISLPESILFVSPTAVVDCPAFSWLVYRGTQEQWEQLQIVFGNNQKAPNGAQLTFQDEPLPDPPSATMVASGTCGDNLTWTLDSDGLLTISGTGRMQDYPGVSRPPWSSVRDQITTVVVEEGVTSIGDVAFKNSSIQVLILPRTILSIGKEAFSFCESLTEVRVYGTQPSTPDGDSRTGIGISAFQGCRSLSTLTIPDGIVSIDEMAFSHCKELVSLTIPENVTHIGENAFSSCKNLTTVLLPLSITHIDGDAFRGTQPWHVLYRGTKTQWRGVRCLCVYLNSATFHYSSDGSEVTDPAGKVCTLCASVCKHIWDNGTVTTEPTCNKKGVKTYTCAGCNETKTESIPKLEHTWDSGKATKEPTCKEDGVKTFTCTVCGETETESIPKLTEHTWDSGKVTKEPTCKEDGVKTFTCSVCKETKAEAIARLTEHTYGEDDICTVCGANDPAATATEGSCGKNLTWRYENNVLTISGTGDMTDYDENSPAPWHRYKDTITKVVMESGLTSIGEYAFFYMNLTEIIIPEGVTAIGAHAFDGCDGLVYVVIPKSVTGIMDFAFQYCVDLWHVLYTGSQAQWDQVQIYVGNDRVTEAARHDNCTGNEQIDVVLWQCELCMAACNHSWKDRTTEREPTCKEAGAKIQYCKNCDNTQRVSIPKLTTHTWNEGEVTKEGTCTEAGERTVTCILCGETQIFATDKLKPHTYGEDHLCTVCGAEDPSKPTEPPTEPPAEAPAVEKESFPVVVAVVLIIIVLLAAGSVTGIVLWKKKK